MNKLSISFVEPSQRLSNERLGVKKYLFLLERDENCVIRIIE